MARRTTTYAIRLAVEGGGQVKAELVSVGQSGEQSLKRIETAGERASGGLKGVGRQAELLRTGIRTLGGALIGAATAGGLGALIDRSISAANAIGKTADTIGVGVEALQELRFAAKASGIEQQTLDMALQRFTRRTAEAAQGTATTSPLVLSDAQALRCMVLKLTGTHPGGAYQVHCPTNKKIYVVWNSTAGAVTFKTVAGTGIPVGAGAVLILYCDGTNVIQLAGLVATIDDIGDVVITAAASGQMLRFNGSSWVNEDSPYDVGMFIPGTHANGALMAQVVLTRAVSFADDFAGARAYAGVSATAATVLDVHRNGSPIGTITFGIGASTGTFATAGGGAETFAAGDRLAIINENPADATLADLSITFLGKRT
jgi:hypothetical protein